MIKIYKLLFGEVKRKEEETKEGNVSTLKVSDSHFANSNSDIRSFGLWGMWKCGLSLYLAARSEFSAGNIAGAGCKLTKCSCKKKITLKLYKILCTVKCLEICWILQCLLFWGEIRLPMELLYSLNYSVQPLVPNISVFKTLYFVHSAFHTFHAHAIKQQLFPNTMLPVWSF